MGASLSTPLSPENKWDKTVKTPISFTMCFRKIIECQSKLSRITVAN